MHESRVPLSPICSMWHHDQLGGNETDHVALLAIKDKITKDPMQVTRSLNKSLHLCQWKGVSCSRHQRVTILNLNSQGMVGFISPSIGNLSFLRILDLSNNSFQGAVTPDQSSVQVATGLIPPSIYNLSYLTTSFMRSNQVQGSLPRSVGVTLHNIKVLSLSANQLNGIIPVSISNVSNLEILELSINNFFGGVPSLASLKKLSWLGASGNNLGKGQANELSFITSLINCSQLRKLNLDGNNFGGQYLVP
ncbi:hypothetical protein CRYUN_Cryun13aG0066000 [Craigia yunnanensis]